MHCAQAQIGEASSLSEAHTPVAGICHAVPRPSPPSLWARSQGCILHCKQAHTYINPSLSSKLATVIYQFNSAGEAQMMSDDWMSQLVIQSVMTVRKTFQPPSTLARTRWHVALPGSHLDKVGYNIISACQAWPVNTNRHCAIQLTTRP